MDSDKINTSNFDYEKFSSILDAARRKSKKHDYYCCIPGCNKKALDHSHIIPQSALKKYICDDNKINNKQNNFFIFLFSINGGYHNDSHQ